MEHIMIDPHVNHIAMPENLRVGLMVSEQRKKCGQIRCECEYAGFAFGQSPFPVPDVLKRGLAEHTDKGQYSVAEGIPELRQAIAGFNKRHYGLDVDPKRIIVGPGSKGLIFSIFTMISGDFIIPSPSWIGYYPQLKLLGKHYHTFYLKPEFKYRIQPGELDFFLSKIADDKRQHLLILNNPHNPTGVVYSRQELVEIAGACRRNNTLILSDEIYALSTYNFEDFTSMGLIYPEGTFITNGLSKDRSAGGYRLGSCILPQTESDKLRLDFAKIAATVYTNVSTPTQYAAISAYEPNDELEEYFAITRSIHRIMGGFFSEAFDRIEGIRATTPEGAFYFYADFNLLSDHLRRKGVFNANRLGSALLDHPYHIATITGDALMARPNDYTARIAFVDYDGAETYRRYKAAPPESEAEEADFVKQQAPSMVRGIDLLKTFVQDSTH